MLLSMFIRSGISNRSFMQSCCVFATSFHTGHAYNELGGDRHARPIRPRKEPGSSDATRSAAAYRISRRMEEEASGAHCREEISGAVMREGFCSAHRTALIDLPWTQSV